VLLLVNISAVFKIPLKLVNEGYGTVFVPEPVGEAGLLLAQPVVVGDAAEVDLLHELRVLPDQTQ